MRPCDFYFLIFVAQGLVKAPSEEVTRIDRLILQPFLVTVVDPVDKMLARINYKLL